MVLLATIILCHTRRSQMKPRSPETVVWFNGSSIYRIHEQEDRLMERGSSFASRNQENARQSDTTVPANQTTTLYRVTRNTDPCLYKIVREFDNCRKKVIHKVVCHKQNVACLPSVKTHSFPKCETVFGYNGLRYYKRCDPIPIRCQCAT